MGSIVLRVSELKRLAGELARERMDYVQVTLLEGDAGDALPPSATFTGLRADRPFELVDFDTLEGATEAEANFALM
ncbi:MAG: hypothetical protein VB041_06380 [Candidatus Limiplasma sp.]|nr:hypothetical protein [Candidatus Limiplasma sp.]